MLSSGANVIIWDKMLTCGANVVMLSFGANVIIWYFHVMLSSGMITPPYFIFPENFTHSFLKDIFILYSLKKSPRFTHFPRLTILQTSLSFEAKCRQIREL
jgi:hypothetical protein